MAKLTNKQQLRKQADILWSKAIKKKHKGKCFVCREKGVDPHHFVPRSLSLSLRYDLENGIFLCRGCHFDIHFKSDPMIGLVIAFKKGRAWVEYLRIKKKERIKYTTLWLKEQLEKLKAY